MCVNHFLCPKPVCNWGEMTCLKSVGAMQWGEASANQERKTGSHLQTGACTGSLLMAIWCILGAIRGRYMLGVWGLWQPYSWQLAQTLTYPFTMTTHADRCPKTSFHTCASLSLCFSAQQVNKPTSWGCLHATLTLGINCHLNHSV